MGFDIDLSQVRALAADMHAARSGFHGEARKVVSKGALNVKNDMAGAARTGSRGGGTHNRIAADISYDFVGPLSADVGPTLGDTGSLQLLYFGNSNTGPSIPDPIRSANKEANPLERHLADVGEDAVW